MTDHFRHIYAHAAPAYHRMIAVEDVEQELNRALTGLTDWAGKTVLDVGSGTGRLPLLFHALGAQCVGLDVYWAMLVEQAAQRAQVGGRWPLAQADARALPFPAASVDAVTAGWALGHFVGWYGENWQTEIDAALREMQRVTRPGGWVVIFETLSTGSLTPAPPHEGLARYYAHLENAWGFTRQTLATDYQFASVAEAVAHTEFFFGAALAEKIRRNGWARVPEWTGMFCKRT